MTLSAHDAALVTLLERVRDQGDSTCSMNGGRAPPPPPSALADIPQIEVMECIGAGAMGTVYRAWQPHLERAVALKVLPAGPRGSSVERFAREARALARLDHPHIVRLFDFGQTATWLYLVMELVDGATLRDLMRIDRPGPAEALRIIRETAAALAHAHACGVVHRDLKPENILVDARGAVRVTDFGLAKLREDPAAGLTASGTVLGTFHYMAPEQVAGSPGVDQRADLYALGVVAYELLTGRLPLGRFEPPSSGSAVDGRVDGAVMRCLEREPAARWSSAGEFLRSLEVPAITVVAGTLPSLPALPAPPAPHGLRIGPLRLAWNTTAPLADRDGTGWIGGMALLVGGVFACLGLAMWGDEEVEILDRVMVWGAPIMAAGGIALLTRGLMPVAVAGVVAALVSLPWLWQLGHHAYLVAMGVVVLAVLPLLDPRRIAAHYATLPAADRRWRWLWTLLAVLCSCALLDQVVWGDATTRWRRDPGERPWSWWQPREPEEEPEDAPRCKADPTAPPPGEGRQDGQVPPPSPAPVPQP